MKHSPPSPVWPQPLPNTRPLASGLCNTCQITSCKSPPCVVYSSCPVLTRAHLTVLLHKAPESSLNRETVTSSHFKALVTSHHTFNKAPSPHLAAEPWWYPLSDLPILPLIQPRPCQHSVPTKCQTVFPPRGPDNDKGLLLKSNATKCSIEHELENKPVRLPLTELASGRPVHASVLGSSWDCSPCGSVFCECLSLV